MLVRVGMVAAALCFALPAGAGELNFDEAKRLVVGKVFSYTCFDGTTGAGRIQGDGSVAGSIRVSGTGPQRFVSLPAGTLHNRGGSVCASLKGLPFSPCFNLVQTAPNRFRGSIYGLSFAYCEFVRRGGRIELARATSARRAAQAASAAQQAE
jgi:hypothetical protein